MKKFFEHHFIRKSEIFLSSVGYLIALNFFLIILSFTRRLVDYVEGTVSCPPWMFAGMILTVVFIQMGLVVYFGNFLIPKFSLKIGERIFRAVFRLILKLSTPEYQKYNQSTLFNILFVDSFAVSRVYLTYYAVGFGIALNVVTIIVLLGRIHLPLMLITLAFIPVYTLILKLTGPYVKDKNQAFISENDAFFAHLKHTNEHIPNIRRAGYVSYFLNQTQKRSAIWVKKKIVADFTAAIVNNSLTYVRVLAELTVLFVGMAAVTRSQMTIGTLLMYISLVGYLFEPLGNFFGLMNYKKTVAPQQERVFGFLEEKRTANEERARLFSSEERGVRVLGEIRNPKGDKLYDADFSLPDHGLFIIKGRNGSGKSTLLNILSGQMSTVQCQGDISLAQEFEGNIAQLNYPLFLLDGNQEDNIALGDKLNKSLMTLFDLPKNESVTTFPLNISSGEAQKLVLLRVLHFDRKMNLLDEPFTNLEQKAMAALKGYIEAEKNNKLFLVIMHDASLDDIADGFLIIDGDRMCLTQQAYRQIQSEKTVAKTV